MTNNKIQRRRRRNIEPEIAETLTEVAQILSIMLEDDEPCRFDHHGYCQAHGWMDNETVCPHAQAKKALQKLKDAGLIQEDA